VILGAGLYFLIQLPTLIHLHKLPVLTKRIDWQTVRAVVRLSLPRTLGSSLSNLTFVAISALASLLAIGSVSVFQFSYNIENTPLLVFGISYAVAAFPTMSAFFTEGNMSALRDVLYRATRNIFFFTMPIALLMIVLRAHVVRLILGAGRFSWNDTRLVAASVALFCISITAQSMVLLLVRAFFAVGDTKTPLRINVGAVVVTILSATALVWCYHHNLFFQSFINSLLRIDGVSGGSVILLALAFSLGQIGNALALWKRFHKRNPHIVTGDGTLRRNLGHITAASSIAAAIA
jgi:putative peptidoglycan lipid II flippase